MEYEIIEQKEILHEGYADLLAALHRKADREGTSIDEAEIPLREAYVEAKRIYGDLLGNSYSTQDDIDMLKESLARLRSTGLGDQPVASGTREDSHEN